MKRILSFLILSASFLLLSACGHKIVIVNKNAVTKPTLTQSETKSEAESETQFVFSDMKWIEKYFKSILDFEKYEFITRHTYYSSYTGAANCDFDVNLKIEGEDFANLSNIAEFGKIGFEFFEIEDSWNEGLLMSYPSYAEGYFKNKEGAEIGTDLVSDDPYVPLDDLRVKSVSFTINSNNKDDPAKSPHFEINGSIDKNSTIQDVVNEFGTPPFLDIGTRSKEGYSASLRYRGRHNIDGKSSEFYLTFGFSLNKDGSTLNNMSYTEGSTVAISVFP